MAPDRRGDKMHNRNLSDSVKLIIWQVTPIDFDTVELATILEVWPIDKFRRL